MILEFCFRGNTKVNFYRNTFVWRNLLEANVALRRKLRGTFSIREP